MKPLSNREKELTDEHPARYGFAYFCNPNMGTLLGALPGTWEEMGKKDELITAKE